jgi:sugar/nucleoside kinase (ribokinase family)
VKRLQWIGGNHLFKRTTEVVVAGHICLDIIPSILDKTQGMNSFLVPGKLIEIGQALISTGGAVSNTGLALHRLGFHVKLMGKVGDDLFGTAILNVLQHYGAELTEGMIVSKDEHSSYTIVISPPGVDRIFLHSTGANDTFRAEDVELHLLEEAKLFHFGYPPLMHNMYQHDGKHLVNLLSRVKASGKTISLDLAKPDPVSPAGQADWRTILSRALPYVDVFLPSFEEILYMLKPQLYKQMQEDHGTEELLPYANDSLLSSLAEELLDMGAAIVGLKLGEYGLYVRTSSDSKRFAAMGACAPTNTIIDNWIGKELLAPCFQVKVVGTTGAGDCTIAGFLGGLLQGQSIEQMMLSAVGVGACNVERADAISGIPEWDEVQLRITCGWQKLMGKLPLDGWNWDEANGIWMKISSAKI